MPAQGILKETSPMKRFFHFIQYNNLVPMGLFIVFGTSGLALAANEDVQKAVYAVDEEVRSVDNTYIVSVDLEDFDFKLRIKEIREDAELYYVKYTYETISLLDYVWQEETITKTLEVSKKSVAGKDLGLFVARQMSEVIAAQLTYLEVLQEQEQKSGTTVKKVAKLYSGLVGKMFDPTEEEFPGYKPVVKELPTPERQVAALAEPFVSQIAMPHVLSEEEIERMVNDMYRTMLTGTAPTDSASTTATSTPPDEPTNDNDSPVEEEISDDDEESTGTTTPPEEPVVEEPATEEPPVEEPIIEEPVVEEPATPVIVEPEPVTEPDESESPQGTGASPETSGDTPSV